MEMFVYWPMKASPWLLQRRPLTRDVTSGYYTSRIATRWSRDLGARRRYAAEMCRVELHKSDPHVVATHARAAALRRSSVIMHCRLSVCLSRS